MKTNTQASNVRIRSVNEIRPDARTAQQSVAEEEREPESQREIRPRDSGLVWGFSRLFRDYV